MGTGELLGKPDEILVGGQGGAKFVMDWHLIQGGVVIILVAFC